MLSGAASLHTHSDILPELIHCVPALVIHERNQCVMSVMSRCNNYSSYENKPWLYYSKCVKNLFVYIDYHFSLSLFKKFLLNLCLPWLNYSFIGLIRDKTVDIFCKASFVLDVNCVWCVLQQSWVEIMDTENYPCPTTKCGNGKEHRWKWPSKGSHDEDSETPGHGKIKLGVYLQKRITTFVKCTKKSWFCYCVFVLVSFIYHYYII